MGISHEDVQELKEVFDDRYVLRGDCDNTQSRINSSFAKDDKRIEIIQHDFSVIKKLVGIVATASIGSLITALFELILR